MEKTERIHWIDAAKGFCMLSVIAGHLGVSTIVSITFAYHLTVFFLLSGYTMRRQDVTFEYCRKKFVRLMVPYFLTCLCVMAMDIVNSVVLYHDTSSYTITSLIADDILRSFLASGSITTFGTVEIGIRIGAVWFFPAMYFALIFTQLILNHISDWRCQFLITLLCAAAGTITGRFLWLPFSIQSAAFATPFLWIGYQARQRNWLSLIKIRHIVICSLCTAAAVRLGVSRLYFVTANANDLLITPLIGLMSGTVVIWLSMKLEGCRALSIPLEFIGRNSMYYLCLHLFEMETMQTWFWLLLTLFGITDTGFCYYVCYFIAEFCFITAGTLILLGLQRLYTRHHETVTANERAQLTVSDNGRLMSVDVARGILIILMLLGHYSYLDGSFRVGIYSFHMMGFVLLSGYFFKPEDCRNLQQSALRLVRTLLVPYAMFGAAYILISHEGITTELQKVLYGISYTDKLFTNIGSIGPVYFILMLFLVRLIYLCAARVAGDPLRLSAVVLLLSLVGYYLGKYGYWLPWSLDCALYSLIFYHIGYLMRRYQLLEAITRWYPSYFILSVLWFYMLYKGGMELAVRDYGSYGIVIVGAVSAILLLVMLSDVLCRVLPTWCVRLLSLTGQSTMYILILHKLFGSKVLALASRWLTEGYIYHMVLFVAVSVVLGVALYVAVRQVKRIPKMLRQG